MGRDSSISIATDIGVKFTINSKEEQVYLTS